MKAIYLFFAFVLLNSCSKVKYYTDKNIDQFSLNIAHRGGSNKVYADNTIEGCKSALLKYDGVEVDIQISKDKTIWLSHDVDVMDGNINVGCFPEISDAIIEQIDSAAGHPYKYAKLEDLISWMSENTSNKYLSIDLKGWIPCSGNHLDMDGMMRLEAEIVAKLGNKYHFSKQIMIETETITTLFQARKFSNEIGLFLNNYGDLEKGLLMALKYKLHGISFKCHVGDSLSKEYADLFHKKGLRINAWNIQSDEEINILHSYGIDFLQFDIP